MAVRELYEGSALQSVDDKGRAAIPADLRAAVERNSDIRSIVVSRNALYPCLTAHDLSWSQEKYSRIDVPGESPFAADEGSAGDKRRAFGPVERAQFDGSGRFVLPPFFRAKAEIGKWAFFSGAGEAFDIWAPHKLLASANPAHAEIREYCEFLCQQKGVAQ